MNGVSRYIDADKLLEKLDDIYYNSEQYSQRYSHSGDAKDAIQNTLVHIQNIVHNLLNEYNDDGDWEDAYWCQID